MEKKWPNLIDSAAGKRLQALARQPFDLTLPESLVSHNRLENYVCDCAGFRMMYATQRVTDEVLDALQDLSDECGLVDQFREMRRGAIMNRISGFESESRQALHTACRDLFSDEPAEPGATGQARRELARLNEFLQEIDTGRIVNEKGEKFSSMIHVGIGGSDLGPRSIYEALQPYGQSGRKVFFISNVDPDDAFAVLTKVDLSTALVNIVSKSGTTLETLTNEIIVRDALQKAGLDPRRHCVAVTGEGSPMDNPDEYLRSFHMFDYIGGRYSATSMVGAVMLGFFLGYSQVVDFLQGASEIDEAAENPEMRRNLPLLLAMLGIWNHNFLGCPTLAILPYSQALHRFPAHLQQCDMESNGKSVGRDGSPVACKTGPVIWGEPGTNGQHAFYQLLHQGTEIVPVEFIGCLNSQRGADVEVAWSTSQQKLIANLLAQAMALAVGNKNTNPNKNFEGNRPSSLLLIDRLTPRAMGTLLALYEAKIVFQGFAWNINSFDQEGVQLGKVLAGRFLDCLTGKNSKENGIEPRLLKVALEKP
jgi:glucose-6-phosphate isomerase